jgi:hypothetical protein
MAKKSGISVENIINMYGIDAATIVSIGGISTSNIPGWPSSGGCETLNLGCSPTTLPGMVCIAPRNDYQFDSTNNILYAIGELCGGTPAPNGFYSDGKMIYSWSGGDSQIWEIVGFCKR